MVSGDADFIVIGAGIAGASAGYGLCRHGRVLLLDQEHIAGYHTTGRSAAFFAETYGNEAVRRLTTASKAFFQTPPDDFSTVPLVHDRGALFIARPDQQASLQALYADKNAVLPSVAMVDAVTINRRVPLIRPDYAAAGVWDPDCQDIFVHAMHQGFLKTIQRHGGQIHTNQQVQTLRWAEGCWTVVTTAGATFTAPVVVNAAGAWGDQVAVIAGAEPVGLVPKRRTIVMIPAPEPLAHNAWPLVLDADDQFYFKPESGRILASPGDVTPMPPQDVQPDEQDVAVAVARVQSVLDIAVPRIERKWAGLRSFTADETPVVGFDPIVPGLFWCVGQGGFGMQTAPAMAALTESLIVSGGVSRDLAVFGITADLYAPGRTSLLPTGQEKRRRVAPPA